MRPRAGWLAATLLLTVLPVCGQARSAHLQCAIRAAAELTAAGPGATGNAVLAAPGARTTLTFSYRASKLAGRVAITVRALGDAGAPIALQIAGAVAPVWITPGAAGVVLWSAGAGAHGLRHTLQVQSASQRPVELVYAIAAS